MPSVNIRTQNFCCSENRSFVYVLQFWLPFIERLNRPVSSVMTWFYEVIFHVDQIFWYCLILNVYISLWFSSIGRRRRLHGQIVQADQWHRSQSDHQLAKVRQVLFLSLSFVYLFYMYLVLFIQSLKLVWNILHSTSLSCKNPLYPYK